MRGQMLGVNRDKMEILVKHEEIPGLMAAMTMPWKVQTANMLDNIGPGDLITSEIVVDDNQGVVTKITKLGTAKPDVPAPAGPATARREVPGAGRRRCRTRRSSIRTAARATSTAIRGDRAMAVTFIYTKCPIPTFCPAMDRQFAEAQALIKDKRLEGKAALLSVSFDPKNDTPPVLDRARAKARRRSEGVDVRDGRSRGDRSLCVEPAADAGARRGRKPG